MSLDKSILYKKEKRKPFYKSQRFDRSCRPHGGCSYCERGRLAKFLQDKKYAKQAINEYLSGYNY